MQEANAFQHDFLLVVTPTADHLPPRITSRRGGVVTALLFLSGSLRTESIDHFVEPVFSAFASFKV